MVIPKAALTQSSAAVVIPPDPSSILQDHASTEKANSYNDLGGYPARVCGMQQVYRRNNLDAVSANTHEQGRTQTNQRVCPKADRFAPETAFKADDQSEQERDP